jgi:hypothetical protein
LAHLFLRPGINLFIQRQTAFIQAGYCLSGHKGHPDDDDQHGIAHDSTLLFNFSYAVVQSQLNHNTTKGNNHACGKSVMVWFRKTGN